MKVDRWYCWQGVSYPNRVIPLNLRTEVPKGLVKNPGIQVPELNVKHGLESKNHSK